MDVFDTEALRTSVLHSWSQSPTRLREDANAEEDYARRYYRDRVILELAQNASDAAMRSEPGVAGAPGKRNAGTGTLQLRLFQEDGQWIFTAANTGTPLDARGVTALASLRASSKTSSTDTATDPENDSPTTIGRFGVGFAAVRSIADNIEVRSTTGSIKFDTGLVRGELEALADSPEPAAVLASGRPLPILRLPYQIDSEPANGFATEIVMHLFDKNAAIEVAEQLALIDDLLLLSLPGLSILDGEYPRHLLAEDEPNSALTTAFQIKDVHDRWRTVTRSGSLSADELRDLPHEDRLNNRWSVQWAWPMDATLRADPSWPIQAPTPTDEQCSTPAVLIGSFPLDPTRRRITPGLVTSRLLAEAAGAYGDLVEELAESSWWQLVPIGPVSGVLDAQLRAALMEALQHRRFLPSSAGRDRDEQVEIGDPDDACQRPEFSPLMPRDARAAATDLMAQPGLVALATDLVPEMVAVPAIARLAASALRLPEITLTELLAVVAARARQDAGRGNGRQILTRLYDALSGALGRDQLSELPVQLADGRVIEGARGVLIPAWSADPDPLVFERFTAWGLRLADPISNHPVVFAAGGSAVSALGLLGSTELSSVTMVRLDAVLDGAELPWTDGDMLPCPTGGVFASWPQDRQLYEVSESIIALAQMAVDSDPGSQDLLEHSSKLAWLGELPLPDEEGEPSPASQLAFTDSLAARIFARENIGLIASALPEGIGREPLVMLGVREGLSIRSMPGVVLDAGMSSGWQDDGEEPEGRVIGLPASWPEYLNFVRAQSDDGAYLGEQEIILDIDLVEDTALAAVVEAIREDPASHRAVFAPVTVDGGGSRVLVPSFSAWWLRREVPWSAHELSFFVMPGADSQLTRLAPNPPGWLRDLSESDPQLAATLGGVTQCAELSADGWGELLGLAVEDDDLSAGAVLALWRDFAASIEALDVVPLPDVVVGLSVEGNPERVKPGELVVCGEPHWLPHVDGEAFIAVEGRDLAALLAEALGARAVHLDDRGRPLPMRVDCSCEGDVVATTEAVQDLLGRGLTEWRSHDELLVGGTDVTWWVESDRTGHAMVHAATLDGAARGLAWATGRWELRAQVLELLETPGSIEPVIAAAFASRSGRAR